MKTWIEGSLNTKRIIDNSSLTKENKAQVDQQLVS